MLADKSQRTTISIRGINETVARKIARREFKESYAGLIYNEEKDQYFISIKKNIDVMSEKEKKKLKQDVEEFEQDKEWKNCFKVEVLNIVEL